MNAADKRARRIKFWRVFLSCLAALIVLGSVGVFTYARIAKSERDAELKLAAEAGLPKSWEDLRRPYNPDRDAREPLRAFQDAWKTANLPQAGQPGPSLGDEKNHRVKVVRAHPELAQLAKNVLSRTELNMFESPEQGFQTDFSRLTQTKAVMDYCRAKATVLSEEGDPIAALSVLQESAKLVKLTRQDSSSLIAELVATAIEAILIKSTLDILTKHARQPSVQSKALFLVENLGRPSDVKRALQLEFAAQLVEEHNLATKGPEYYNKFFGLEPMPFEDEEEPEDRDPRVEKLLLRMRIPGTRDVLFKNLFRAFRELYLDLPGDPYDGFARLQVAKKHIKIADKKMGEMEYLIPIMIDTACSTVKSDLRGIAERRALKALILSLQIRTKTGRFPTELPLSGAEAMDPFSGEPLKFKQLDGYLVAYSAGYDGVDDGGQNVITSGLLPKDIGFGIR